MLTKPILNSASSESDDGNESTPCFISQGSTDGNSFWVAATVTSGFLSKHDQRWPEHLA